MDKGINDDKLADTNSEAFRFYCEVISVVRMFRTGGSDKVKSYLYKVEKNRGAAATERLRLEAWEKIKAKV